MSKIISLKPGDRLRIGDEITVSLLDIRRAADPDQCQAKLGIDRPIDINVHRAEADTPKGPGRIVTEDWRERLERAMGRKATETHK